MKRKMFFVGLTMLSVSACGQSKFMQPNFSSSGGTVSTNSTQRVYSVIGQPIAISNTTRSQTQAGFMQVVDYVIADAIAPTITYTGAALKINKQSPPTFTATITDNVAVATAKIHYRKISSATWNEAPLAKNGNSYSAAIQSTWFDAMGMEYYFTASDATPNTKLEPATGSYYGYTTSNEETIPSGVFGFGSTVNNYKIISFPYTTSNNSVTSLFEELGTYSDTKWRMASYNNANGEFTEYPTFTTMMRGTGYWFLAKTPVDIKVGPVQSLLENRAALYRIQLKPGWNMIGNPYPVPIDWSDVRTLNNNPNLGEIKVYTSGFTNGDLIAAYQGGFVFVNGASDIEIKIPFVGQETEGGRKKEEFSNDIASDKWLMNLSINQGTSVYQLGGFGMHQDGLREADQFDDYNPPAFISSPEINFPHPEHTLGSFCRDVLPVQHEAVWSFTAQGEIGESMTFNWNSDLGTSQKELFLVDESNLTIIDFRAVNQYTFVLGKGHSFKIYFGEHVREKISSTSISLLAPYPNPVSRSGKPTFKIALPDNGSSYSLQVEIVNSTGASLGSFSKTLLSGIHELTVDLNPERISSGMHYYRVSVNSGQDLKVFTGKLIIR